nr:cob(I)yrinic acid a,c-diamide adenosyltransferase [Chrysiogenes arsenatis]
MLRQGYTQVYTGNGKGKTTAAFGLALRSVGRGLRVCVVQFLKGGGAYGEHFAADRFAPLLTVHQTGRDVWITKGNLETEDITIAQQAFKTAQHAIFLEGYDVVILDEINCAVWFGLIPVDDVVDLIAKKPPCTELVLTGRYADEKVIEKADLVTEMREIKHYYQVGVDARVGIEK